jgi:uncharacterized membrane protein YhaH (DUF805 family)
MDFAGAIKSGLINWKEFRGTAGLSEFWYFALFLWIVGQIVNLVDLLGFEGYRQGALFLQDENSFPSPASLLSAMPWFSIAVSLVTMIPSLSMTYRRIQDGGRNGNLVFLQFVPLALFVVAIVVSFTFLESFASAPESDTSMIGPALIVLGSLLLGIGSGIAWVVLWFIWTLAPTKTAAQGNKYVN